MERTDNIGFGNIKLIQDTDGFCYGVDAVILADFVKHSSDFGTDRIIYDLGTGNGIIPLILSSDTEAVITGIEIQKKAYDLAVRNAELNSLDDRISFINSDVRDYKIWGENVKSKVDVVMTNPPYMSSISGLKSDNDSKTIARHETTADLSAFIKAAAYLLKDRGNLFMVHRPSRLVDIFSFGRENKLEAKEIKFVSPKYGEIPNIVLIHMVKNGGKELKILPTLAVHNEDGSYTEELGKCYKKKG